VFFWFVVCRPSSDGSEADRHGWFFFKRVRTACDRARLDHNARGTVLAVLRIG
jgi:hypothetical protein